MARLGNPHVVQVSDFQHAPDEPAFLVMELLTGRSMRELLIAEGLTSSSSRSVRPARKSYSRPSVSRRRRLAIERETLVAFCRAW